VGVVGTSVQEFSTELPLVPTVLVEWDPVTKVTPIVMGIIPMDVKLPLPRISKTVGVVGASVLHRMRVQLVSMEPVGLVLAPLDMLIAIPSLLMDAKFRLDPILKTVGVVDIRAV